MSSINISCGTRVFLIAVGLILALAVNVDLSGIDVQTIGWILTLVGVGGLVLSLTVWNRRRVAVREQAVVRDQPVVGSSRLLTSGHTRPAGPTPLKHTVSTSPRDTNRPKCSVASPGSAALSVIMLQAPTGDASSCRCTRHRVE